MTSVLDSANDMLSAERHGWKSCGGIDTPHLADDGPQRPHTSLRHPACKPCCDAAHDTTCLESTLPRSLSAILADVSMDPVDTPMHTCRTPSPPPLPCYPEWQHLPDDLLKRILSFLPNSYLRVMRLVCRQWEHATARFLTSLAPETLALHPPLSHRCPALVSLDLSNCLTEVHCFRAKELGLRSLMHDGHLGSLAGLRRLTELKLRGCSGITAAGLATLARLTTLQKLDVSRCAGVDDHGLRLLTGLSRLQVLSLAGCVNVSDAGLVTLVALTQLRHLNLAGCRVTNNGVQAIAQMQSALLCVHNGMHANIRTGLQRLNLDQCANISDAGLVWLAVLPSLRHVSVSWGSCVLGLGLQALAQLTSLQTLDISYTHVTPISVVETQMGATPPLPFAHL